MNPSLQKFLISAGIIGFILLLIAIIAVPPILAHIYREREKKSHFENLVNNDGNMGFPILNDYENKKSKEKYAMIDNQKKNFILGRRAYTNNRYKYLTV
jgi:hypothetical protein